MPTLAELLAHPLAVFLREFQEVRDLLVLERIEQKGIAENGSARVEQHADANAAVLDLTAAIAKLDECRTLFLVKVFIGEIAPSPALVAKTIDLNIQLAALTVADNLASAYLALVTAYVDGATQVISGNVPAAAPTQ